MSTQIAITKGYVDWNAVMIESLRSSQYDFGLGFRSQGKYTLQSDAGFNYRTDLPATLRADGRDSVHVRPCHLTHDRWHAHASFLSCAPTGVENRGDL